MFKADRKSVLTGSDANAIMSQHVAQKSTGESKSAIMSQHVAQQSICFDPDKAFFYRYL